MDRSPSTSKAVVICPDRRGGVAALARRTSLALVPVLGPSVLSQTLTDLARRGAREIVVLASDRPDEIRGAVGGGERWGLRIEVRAEASEISVEEARRRHRPESDPGWLPEGRDVVRADRLPDEPDHPLFESYEGFWAAARRRLLCDHAGRVGAKEIQPGIWMGLRSRVHPTARLLAPCWIGEGAWVRARATVGPHAVVEDGAVVDEDAEVAESWIGPRTYVGAMTEVRTSLACGNSLANWRTGSVAEIVDAFLLGDLASRRMGAGGSPWYARGLAMLAAAVTSPVVLGAWLGRGRSGQPLFLRQAAMVPAGPGLGPPWRELAYAELNGVRGWARRWPQLWSIVRGDFTWVGNRPLHREQAEQLQAEFEQLWLSAPIGLLSLADAHGCGDVFDDETRAHASFYAARASRRLDLEVLRRVVFRAFQPRRRSLNSASTI